MCDRGHLPDRQGPGDLLIALTCRLWFYGHIAHHNVHFVVYLCAGIGDRFYPELRHFYDALGVDDYPGTFLLRRGVKAYRSRHSAQSQLRLEIGFPFPAPGIAFRLEGVGRQNNGRY
jgi:hypothetical protein